MTTYLITGATGRLGSTALSLAESHDPIALVRTTAAADRLSARRVRSRVADYSDAASLTAAFRGVDRLLFVSSPALDPATRLAHHLAVLDAALEAGVVHITYTSARGADHDPGHRGTEEALASSGINHTILRNALYTEPFVDAARSAGVVLDASGGARVATASIADLAAAAVTALTHELDQRVWELRGPGWSYTELADAVSLPRREADDAHTGAFAPLFPLIRRGAFADSHPDLQELLGRPARSLAEVAAGR